MIVEGAAATLLMAVGTGALVGVTFDGNGDVVGRGVVGTGVLGTGVFGTGVLGITIYGSGSSNVIFGTIVNVASVTTLFTMVRVTGFNTSKITSHFKFI